MKAFMDQDFLLNSETARTLYHDVAAGQPIIDYHCHLSPREIFENAPYQTITQLWLGADHYKWRLMRSAGVEEKYITGDAPEREKFIKWAETIALAIGNPLYHWSHLELQRYFDYHGPLNGDTAEEVWTLCNEKLTSPAFTPRALITRSNVEAVCTTDDPIDDLNFHQKLAADASFPVTVLPAWRPDRIVGIEKGDFGDYIKALGDASGIPVTDIISLRAALRQRLAYFHENGCRISDHGLASVMYAPATEIEVDAILKRRLSGEVLLKGDVLKYKTACLLFLGAEYSRLNWTMQLHYGVTRDNNPGMFLRLGPDTGFDAIDNTAPSTCLLNFLGALGDELPRTIIYSLNPNDDTVIGSIIGCFQNGRGITKIQHGSAWWFNDHLTGMEQQMRTLAAQGYLNGFVGMLTDSRSFLSYPRHEYFRRILCNILGDWVEGGLYPRDMAALSTIVKNICVDNARKYFEFPMK